MNMPPEPTEPALLEQMQAGLTQIAPQITSLLRYQSTTGLADDRDTAAAWMSQNDLTPDPARLAIAPGSHAAIYAILSQLADPGLTLLCEELTYPGIRAIAANLGLRVIGVPSDTDGLLPTELGELIRTHQPVALYLNPTLQNPNTQTMPRARRKEIAAVLQMYDLPLIEDDAYVFTARNAPRPISSHIPGLGWHVAGLSKLLGAGLRLAYVTVPLRAQMSGFSQTLRTQHVMASPLSLALTARWISDGTATALQRFIRSESEHRQSRAGEILSDHVIQSDPNAFNLWLHLPSGTSRAEILSRMAGRHIGLMPSDAFCTTSTPPEALRVCLGGPITREQLELDLIALDDALTRKDWLG